MYSLNENALEKSAHSPKPLKSLGSGRKPLNLEIPKHDLRKPLMCLIA